MSRQVQRKRKTSGSPSSQHGRKKTASAPHSQPQQKKSWKHQLLPFLRQAVVRAFWLLLSTAITHGFQSIPGFEWLKALWNEFKSWWEKYTQKPQN